MNIAYAYAILTWIISEVVPEHVGDVLVLWQVQVEVVGVELPVLAHLDDGGGELVARAGAGRGVVVVGVEQQQGPVPLEPEGVICLNSSRCIDIPLIQRIFEI